MKITDFGESFYFKGDDPSFDSNFFLKFKK